MILEKEREKGLQRAFFLEKSCFHILCSLFFILSQFINKITLIKKELLFRLLMEKSGYTWNPAAADDVKYLAVLDTSDEWVQLDRGLLNCSLAIFVFVSLQRWCFNCVYCNKNGTEASKIYLGVPGFVCFSV